MEKINKLRRKLKSYNLDGYLIPKNDEFFNEFIPENKDYLRDISNFSGSYGIALILKKNNYLFVDGRYTVQANIQSGKYFQVITLPFKKKKNNLNFKKKRIGFNPKLFNHRSLKHFSQNLGIKCVKINENLNKFVKQKRNYNIKNKFYVLDKAITGQSSLEKIRKLNSFFYKKKIDVMLITSSENIAWLLNIRGQDSDFSPLPNCFLIVDKLMRIYLFCDLKKIDAKFKKKLNYINILKIDEIENFLKKINNKNFLIDGLTCSVFFKDLVEKNNNIKINTDPIYYFKSQKNNREIKNTKKIHEYDGASLTKFLFWIQGNFKKKKLQNYQLRINF